MNPGIPEDELLQVVVSVAVERVDAIDEVASALVAAGLEDLQVLQATGVITGCVHDRRVIADMRAIGGVEGVETAGTFQLPPPDEDLQ